MLGTFCNTQLDPYTYTRSYMSDKMRFAMCIRVRVPMEGTKTRRYMRQLESMQWSTHMLEMATAIAQCHDEKLRDIALSNKIINGVVEGVNSGSSSYVMVQDEFIPWIQNQLGIGDYIRRRSSPIPDRRNALGVGLTGIDTYAIIPKVLDESMSSAPWYVEPELNDIRDCSKLVTPRDMYVSEYTLRNNGIIQGVSSLSCVEATITPEAMSKLWTPNILTTKIYLDPNYVVDPGLRVFALNTSTKQAFPIYNTFVMPSGREYFQVLNGYVPLNITPYTDLKKSLIGWTQMQMYTPDTLRDLMKYGLSSSASKFFINPAVRAFTQTGTGNVAIVTEPLATIRFNVPSLMNTLAKMRKGGGVESEKGVEDLKDQGQSTSTTQNSS